jgi:hypothetical protein
MDFFSNKALSQQLEGAEARFNAAIVDSHAKYSSGSHVEWKEIGGVHAMFDGVESPLTQTFGLGLFEEPTHEIFEKLEAFYHQHNSPIFHEVSPMIDIGHLTLLQERNYRPVELTSVLYKPIQKGIYTSIHPKITTRVISKGEEEVWARTSARGWSTEGEGLSDFMYEFGLMIAGSKGTVPFIAELNGDRISTTALYIDGEVALLAGTSTVPEGRNQGAQSALLASSLHYASSQGCTTAMMCASPGSQSQRNAEKNGFRIAYTRTKWKKFSI